MEKQDNVQRVRDIRFGDPVEDEEGRFLRASGGGGRVTKENKATYKQD